MGSRLSSRLTYANVMATIAVFIALGTGAVAATKLITSPNQIAKGVVKSSAVRNNTLRGIDVRDQSLRAGDFAPGQIPAGPTGPQGPVGSPGISGYDFVSVSSVSNSESPKEIVVDCPPDTFVVGSYYDIAGGKTGAAPNQIARVIADKLLATGANGILSDTPTRVYLQAYESEAITDNWSIRVGVTCAGILLPPPGP